MKYNKIDIKKFSIFVVLLLSSINIFFLYSSSNEHHEQKELIKQNFKNNALAQYNNIESLIRWSAEIDNKKVQSFIMHQEENESGMMFALPYLAEKNKDGLYYFRLTSLNPINPKNMPDTFERRGLNQFSKNSKMEYYDEFNEKDYTFIGRLNTSESCIKCHQSNNEKVGDIRGGVRITIPLAEYHEQIESLNMESLKEFILLTCLFVISILTLIIFIKIVKEKNKLILNYNNNLEKEVEARTLDLHNTFEQTIHSFIKMVEARDSYTAGHSSRVQKYSNIIARHMNFDDDFVNRLDKAAYLHDIGKLYTPDSVLLKPGKLTKTEYELIQQHAIKGFETLNEIDAYQDIAKIVGAHHERYNGRGYPYGLKGEDIPIESRIMAIADSFDAMTTNRIYRARMDVKTALDEIKSLKGKDFDPEIVDFAVEALSHVVIEKTSQLPIDSSEHQRLAYHFKDPLTDLYNVAYLNILVSFGLNGKEFDCLHIINLKNFHQYNKRFGWNKGNEFLKEFSTILEELFPDTYLFRSFGDDFIVLDSDGCLDFTEEIFDKYDILKDNDIWVEVELYDLRKKSVKKEIIDILNLHS